jgi:hypothetical protein
MTRKQIQKQLKNDREELRNKLKVYMRVHLIKQKTVAEEKMSMAKSSIA